MVCATSDQRISNNVPLAALCEKSWVVQNQLGLVPADLIFVQLKFVWEKLKTRVTPASMEFATTNGDRSTELSESFLLMYRYLDFDNG